MDTDVINSTRETNTRQTICAAGYNFAVLLFLHDQLRALLDVRGLTEFLSDCLSVKILNLTGVEKMQIMFQKIAQSQDNTSLSP